MSSEESSTVASEASTTSQIPVPAIAEPSKASSAAQSTSDQTIAKAGWGGLGDENTTNTLTAYTSRPRLGSRKSSGTMIVPADHPEIELKDEVFPPNDARAMSPKRSSAETDRMIGTTRLAMQSHADQLQSGLNALVEKVENIKSDQEKLEKNNSALQDYIGGLTRSMSRTALDTGRKK